MGVQQAEVCTAACEPWATDVQSLSQKVLPPLQDGNGGAGGARGGALGLVCHKKGF